MSLPNYSELVELLQQKREQLAIELDRVSQMIELANGTAGLAVKRWNDKSVTPAPKPDPKATKRSTVPKPKRSKPEPATKPSGGRGEIQDSVIQWAAARPTTKVEDAAEHFGLPRKIAGTYLSIGKRKGVLRSAGWATYEPAEPSVEAPEPPKPAERPPGGFQNGAKQSPQIASILEYAALRGASSTWTVNELIGWMEKHHPEQISDANRQEQDSKRTDLRVRCLDLATNGKLRRMGHGAGAFYGLASGRSAVSEGPAISVPRDADAGDY
jgi:hypothetical protein